MNFELGKKNLLVLLFLIIVLALSMRVYNLNTPSINGDEGSTIFLSERPIAQILKSSEDVQPPLFYGLMHFWIALFGKSEFALRLLPVIFSILAIPVIYKLGKLLFNDKVGLFSAFVFAISQANIRFAQNLRNYSLVTFLTLLSFYFFYSYLSNPDRKKLILFIIASTLAIYTHYFAAFLLVAEFLFLIFYYKKYRELFLKVFGSFVVIVILLLPLIPLILSQTTIKTEFEKAVFEQDPLARISITAPDQNNLFLRISMIFFHFGSGFLEFNAKSVVFVSVFFLSLIVYSTSALSAVKSLYKQDREKLVLILLALIIPFVILSILWATRLIPFLTYARYFLYLSPIYYILIGAGILLGIMNFDILKKPSHKKLVLGIFILLILGFNLVSLQNYYKTDSQRENWRAAAPIINSKASTNEVISIYSGSYSFNLKTYLAKDMEIYTMPENFKVSGAAFSQIYSSSGPINNSNSCNPLKLLNKEITGIWTVNPNPTIFDPEGLVKKCLDANLELANSFESSYLNSRGENITSIQVHHYVTK